MEVAKIVGLGAGVLSTIAFLPQVRHTWRTKSTKAILMSGSGVCRRPVAGRYLRSLDED